MESDTALLAPAVGTAAVVPDPGSDSDDSSNGSVGRGVQASARAMEDNSGEESFVSSVTSGDVDASQQEHVEVMGELFAGTSIAAAVDGAGLETGDNNSDSGDGGRSRGRGSSCTSRDVEGEVGSQRQVCCSDALWFGAGAGSSYFILPPHMYEY